MRADVSRRSHYFRRPPPILAVVDRTVRSSTLFNSRSTALGTPISDPTHPQERARGVGKAGSAFCHSQDRTHEVTHPPPRSSYSMSVSGRPPQYGNCSRDGARRVGDDLWQRRQSPAWHPPRCPAMSVIAFLLFPSWRLQHLLYCSHFSVSSLSVCRAKVCMLSVPATSPGAYYPARARRHGLIGQR